MAVFVVLASAAYPQSSPAGPTFYRDVLPIAQKHCQSCHRPGEMAFPLMTYDDAAPRARGIRESVSAKSMPPWFADPAYGHFSNDPSLPASEINDLIKWAEAGAPAGNPRDAPPPLRLTNGWNISPPDVLLAMPKAVALAPTGDIEYTYEIVPTHFREDRWVQMAELRPSSREHVHHAVVYIRPPDSKWLRGASVGVPFTTEKLTDDQGRRDTHWTDSDILCWCTRRHLRRRIWASGMAKFIPCRVRTS